jgi:nicotinamidase-related amidase
MTSPRLAQLLEPGSTVLLTQECQRGVIGADSSLPALADAARSSGVVGNIAELVASARSARVGVIHAIAARRPDGRGANTNARLFVAAARGSTHLTAGTDRVRVIEEIGECDWDIVSTRLHGLSPIAGTDVDSLLRNLGCRTLVIVGVSSNIAIPNAVFDAVNLGYQVVVPADAIAGVPHEYTRSVIDNALSLIATITTTREVLDAWGEGPHEDPAGSHTR